MIWWGSAGETKDLGVMESRKCQTCEKERPFKLLLQYRWAHVYWLFSWVTEKKYWMACDVCRRGWQLSAADVEPKLEKNPISPMTRYGWTILAGLIIAIVLVNIVLPNR